MLLYSIIMIVHLVSTSSSSSSSIVLFIDVSHFIVQ